MDFGNILHLALTAFYIVLMVCVLVAAHEYGHYLFARLFGMGVEEFAIGFGKNPIWTWMRKSYDVEALPGPAGKPETTTDYSTDGALALQPHEQPDTAPSQVKLTVKETTDFTIRPWPLGGFVRIKGMIPEEDGSETKVPGGFYSKAPWKRFIVLLAGPVFSVLAGVLILFFLTMAVGEERPTTTIRSVIDDGPAAQAGMRPGDKILRVSGEPIKSAYDVSFALKDKAGVPVVVEVERGGRPVNLQLTPRLEDAKSPVLDRDGMPTGELRQQPKMMAQWESEHHSVPAGKAFIDAARFPVIVVGGLARLITKPDQLKENVGGPISIAKATSDATKYGPESVVALAAMLSISVGIFNLLPVPPLDGGQMLVAVAEMLRGGRRLSLKVQGALTAAGLAMVLMLFVSVMIIDVGRLTGGSKKPAVEKTK